MITEPKNETCVHKTKNVTVTVDNCVSDGPVETTMCEGTCGSNAMATFTAPYMKTDCKCCKPTKMSKIKVPLTCRKYQNDLKLTSSNMGIVFLKLLKLEWCNHSSHYIAILFCFYNIFIIFNEKSCF